MEAESSTSLNASKILTPIRISEALFVKEIIARSLITERQLERDRHP